MRSALCTLTLAAVAAAPSAAWPCGAFFASSVSENPAFDAQRALIVMREDKTELHLQMAANEDLDDFVWVFPVPEVPAELALGSDAVFEALDNETTPRVEIESLDDGGGGGGCFGADAGGAPDRVRDSLVHFGGGTLGDYEYDYLSGQDTEEMVTWLEEEGYVVPEGTAAALEPYAAEFMVFIWVKLSRDAAAEPGSVSFDPLVVTLDRSPSPTMGYPLSLSALSAAQTNPVLLYVLANKRYRVSTYGSADLGFVAEKMAANRDEDGDPAGYVETVDAMTASAGGRLFVTEYARDLSERELLSDPLLELIDGRAFYLTRLYARVPADSLVDATLTFADDAPEVSGRVEVIDGAATAASGATLMLLVLAFLGVRRRRSGAASPAASDERE